jgi:NAD(P)-dependent dehydrogenase (short-subunit alcohol dehydrogenase family)
MSKENITKLPGASFALPPRRETFASVFTKHQLWPNSKPKLNHISLLGKTAVITGGNAGIGLECGRIMLGQGLSHLVLASRSVPRGEKAADPLRKNFPEAKIEVWQLDMSSYGSIKTFAQKCTGLSRLDSVILGAGIMNVDFQTSPETGHEEMFQVNYLSQAFLGVLLLPIMQAKNTPDSPGHMTLVASGAAMIAQFVERDEQQLIKSHDKSDHWKSDVAKLRYDDTKGQVLILTHKLSLLVGPKKTIVNVIDPTFTPGTGFFRQIPTLMRVILWPIVTLIGTSVNNAGWRYFDGAVARGEESHGSLISDWEISP